MNDETAELLALFERAARPTLDEIDRARESAPEELVHVFKPIKANLFEADYDLPALRRDVAAAFSKRGRKRREPSPPAPEPSPPAPLPGGEGRKTSGSEPPSPPGRGGLGGEGSPLAQADRLLALFRGEIGLSPILYMLEGRMAVMAQLLIETDLVVPEVGDLVGYPDTAAFRRAARRWTGLAPGHFRARVRDLIARVGPIPAGVLSWSFWNRVRRGELSDQETRRLLAYLEALYEVHAERTPMDAGTVRHAGQRRSLAAELARRLGELPWEDQRRLVRESLHFGTPELYERLCLESRDARRDRGRAVQLMDLAILSLEARADHRGAEDPARLRQAWTRQAWTYRKAGEAVRAERALGFAALEHDPADAEEPPLLAAECLTLEADVLWSLDRDEAALRLLDRALALLGGDAEHTPTPDRAVADRVAPEGRELSARALLLRAAVRLYAPRPARAGVDLAGDDLRRARPLLDATHAPELAELHELWLRLHAMLGDADEIRRALPPAREHGDARLLARCNWYEGVVLRAGDPVRAERCLRDSRAALIDLDLPEQAAPPALELVALHLSRGQLLAAEDTAGHLVDTLEAAARTPERVAALKALRQALRAKNLTPAVLKVVREAVAGLERESKAAAGPAFEL
jgi:hypothetical protein